MQKEIQYPHIGLQRNTTLDILWEMFQRDEGNNDFDIGVDDNVASKLRNETEKSISKDIGSGHQKTTTLDILWEIFEREVYSGAKFIGVLDTCFLMSKSKEDLFCTFYSPLVSYFVVPYIVLQELDNFKNREDKRFSAQRCIKIMKEITEAAPSSRDRARIRLQKREETMAIQPSEIADLRSLKNNNDTRIVECCEYFQREGESSNRKVVLFTKDKLLALTVKWKAIDSVEDIQELIA